jgi:5-aminopentanamidase
VLAAACQISIDIDDPAANLVAMTAAVQDAAERGAELIVLPELAASGYMFKDRAEAWAAAERLDGLSVRTLSQLSEQHGCVIVSGLCERGPQDQLWNSAVVIQDGRLVDVYRKVHLWGSETLIFDPGTRQSPVLNTRAGRLAPMICYDAEFPEWVRLAADAGAEIITVPADWPLNQRPATEQPIEILKAQAFAGTYRVNIIVADRCGVERGQDWIGGSIIVGPDGYLRAGPPATAQPAQPALLLATVDPAEARDKAIGPHNDARTDRRPDLYGPGISASLRQ